MTKEGLPVKGLEAHHLISKGAFPKFRHDINNGICLCFLCHKYGTVITDNIWVKGLVIGDKISAHTQQENFMTWLEAGKPATFEWYQANKYNKKSVEVNFEVAFDRLYDMQTPEW